MRVQKIPQIWKIAAIYFPSVPLDRKRQTVKYLSISCTGDIRVHTNGEFDTVRGIGKVLHVERGNWEGNRGGRRGGSGARKGERHKSSHTRCPKSGAEEAAHKELETAESREIVPTLLKIAALFLSSFRTDHTLRCRDCTWNQSR